MTADIIRSGDKQDVRFLSAREKFNLLPPERRKELITKLDDETAARLNYDWEYNGRPKQLAPDHNKSKATSFCMCAYLEAQMTTNKKLKLEDFKSCDENRRVFIETGPDFELKFWNESGFKTQLDSGRAKIVKFDEPDDEITKTLAKNRPAEEKPEKNLKPANYVCKFRSTWQTWVLLAGRGFGKTRVGAELVRENVEQGVAKRIAIISPTASDARDVAIEGESGLLNICPPWQKPVYESTKRRVTWPNGAQASMFSAEEPERLRGPQFDFAWCLVGETLVNTPTGNKSLYDLQIGEQILTPTGYKTVTNKKLTNPSAHIFTLVTRTAKLTGTFEHKIYSNGEFFQLGEMAGKSCVTNRTLLTSTEQDSKEEKTVIISGGTYDYLTLFGKSTMVLFQMVMKFTTLMATKLTTISLTSNYCHQKNTRNVIQKNEHSTSKNVGKTGSNSKERVCNVVKNLLSTARVQITRLLSFVRSNVTKLGDALNLNQLQRNAKSAQQNLYQNDLTRNTAARNVMLRQVVSEDPNLIKNQVISVEPSGKSSVYDITVDGGVFFANGILVHNCDEIAGYDINTQQMTWDMLNFGLRLGKYPRAVVTTTPKPTPLIQTLVKLSKDPVNRVIITTGSTYENRSNLAAPFMRQITQYEGTNLGRQEIYAELIDIEESGILKRSWFKQWPANKKIPLFDFVIQSYDTAFTDKTHNDPTGCVTFGVFRPDPESPHCIMILDAWVDHLKYPELRNKAKEEYQATYGDQKARVDLILIEDKGSGISLIQDLQRAGLPIRKYNPGRPDKVMRLHAVSHLVYNGRVYIPESKKVPGEFVTWAEDFIRQVCGFPNTEHDEYVDCFSQALAIFRDQEWVTVDPIPEKDPYEDDERELNSYSNPYDC